MRRLAATLALCAPLLLAGCSGADTSVEPTGSTTAPVSSTGEEPTTVEATTVEATTTTETPPPPEVEQPPAASAAPTAAPEPYVVECLGAPWGPALWSDGTTRAADYCVEYGKTQDPYNLEYNCSNSAWRQEMGAEGNRLCGGDPPPVAESSGGSQDRNGDGVISGFERCGTACGEEPTSGEIQSAWFACLEQHDEAYCRENS